MLPFSWSHFWLFGEKKIPPSTLILHYNAQFKWGVGRGGEENETLFIWKKILVRAFSKPLNTWSRADSNIYIYTYTHTHVYICIRTHIYTHTYICVYLYTCMYIYILYKSYFDWSLCISDQSVKNPPGPQWWCCPLDWFIPAVIWFRP